MTCAGSLVWCTFVREKVPDLQDQVLWFFPGEERCSSVLDPRGKIRSGPCPFYVFDATCWFPTHEMVRAEEWQE